MLVKAGLNAQQIADKLSITPRKVLNLVVPVIEVGAEANFTLYDLKTSWLYDEASNKSKSKNSPLINQQLSGKVKLVYNNNKLETYG